MERVPVQGSRIPELINATAQLFKQAQKNCSGVNINLEMNFIAELFKDIVQTAYPIMPKVECQHEAEAGMQTFKKLDGIAERLQEIIDILTEAAEEQESEETTIFLRMGEK